MANNLLHLKPSKKLPFLVTWTSNSTIQHFLPSTGRPTESFDAIFWRIGFLSFQNIFSELAKTESVSLRLTKEVLNGQLHTLIEGLHPQIAKGLNKIEEMRQEELFYKITSDLNHMSREPHVKYFHKNITFLEN